MNDLIITCNNSFTVHFKDGSNFTSTGSTDSRKPMSVFDELKWLSFQITSQIHDTRKTLIDVDRIEITLSPYPKP